MFKRFAVFFALALAIWSSDLKPSQAGMVFNLIDIGGAGIGTQARTGFQTAADFWSSKFNDDIVINLNVGMDNLGESTLGGADLKLVGTSYSNFRTFALADATTSDDANFTTNLPTGPSFSLYINRTSNNPNGPQSATPYLDNDGDANNTTVLLARANAKALGLLNPNDLGLDAEIQFSTAFTFDYDRTNGIASNAFDFIGIAIHEIGHALGFFSGVDILDNPAANGLRDDEFTAVTPLDFSRFSAASQAAGADLDWTVDARSKYFSVNGGTTVDVDDAWSLGRNFGDGRQASHWKDNLGRGIMDPTFAPGELGIVTNLDLRAFDIMGFNSTAVPEPTSVAIFGSGLILLGIVRRKRQKSA
jgi:hypothetical protein